MASEKWCFGTRKVYVARLEALEAVAQAARAHHAACTDGTIDELESAYLAMEDALARLKATEGATDGE